MNDYIVIDDVIYVRTPYANCATCNAEGVARCKRRADLCPAGNGMMLVRQMVSPNGGDI